MIPFIPKMMQSKIERHPLDEGVILEERPFEKLNKKAWRDHEERIEQIRATARQLRLLAPKSYEELVKGLNELYGACYRANMGPPDGADWALRQAYIHGQFELLISLYSALELEAPKNLVVSEVKISAFDMGVAIFVDRIKDLWNRVWKNHF